MERIIAISDLHLGDGSHTDLFGRKDDLLLDFLNHHREADRVVLLGDILDVFQAGNVSRVYASHRAVINKLREISHKAVYVQGNHEGGADVRAILPGIQVVREIQIDGIHFEHGDRMDPFAGDMFAGRVHNFFEKIFHSCLRIPLHDYKSDYNQAMHQLFTAASKFTPPICKMLRAAGFRRLSTKLALATRYWHACIAGDFNQMFEKVVHFLNSPNRPAAMVCGHSHLPGVVKIGDAIYANAGSWAAGNSQYALIVNGKIRVLDYITGKEFNDAYYVRLFSQ